MFVAWADSSSGTNEIMLKASHNNGATWSGATNLSNSQASSSAPNILARATGAESTVDVVWTGTNNGNGVIMAVSSPNTGLSFGSTIAISGATTNSNNPRIDARTGSNSLTVVWVGTSQSGGADVYSSTSNSNGASWGQPINVSNDGTASQPRVSDDGSLGSRVYLVWADTSTGISTIRFATQ